MEFNSRYGLPTTDDMLARMYGKRNDEILREFYGPGLDAGEIAARGAAKEALFRRMMAGELERYLVPGVGEFLARHAGAPAAVASNAEMANVEFVLKASGYRRHFRVVVDGHQVRRPKPHPDIYLLAAERLGIRPANCIVFEDSESGVAAAKAAGMRVVGVRTTLGDLCGVDLAIDNFNSAELEVWVTGQKPGA
jgi:HAD superfamily hydrolase (TIGR01509 family)